MKETRRGILAGLRIVSYIYAAICTGIKAKDAKNTGEVAEWLKALVSKTSIVVRLSRVRIPPSPQHIIVDECRGR